MRMREDRDGRKLAGKIMFKTLNLWLHRLDISLENLMKININIYLLRNYADFLRMKEE